MNKKELIILIIVGISCFILSFIISYNFKTKTKEDLLIVNKYKLHYGKYIGISKEYDPDVKRNRETKLTLELNKDSYKLNDEEKKYTIEDDYLVVDNTKLIKVEKDDTLLLEIGSGVEFKYEK